MDVFKFTGKISLGKESERFKPIERKSFSSGWTNTTVKFNCISDTNRVLCVAQGGKWTDDSKNVIKTFSRATETSKGERIEIPWAKRFDTDQIERVAAFRRFVCDTGDIKMRYKLQDVVNGRAEITQELMDMGVTDMKSAQAVLEKNLAKKRIFLSEWDFAEHVAKIAESDKFKDKMFHIEGYYDIAYGAGSDRYYTNYHVNKIVLAADDAEPKTGMKVDFYFGSDAFDDSQYEESGKAHVTGWLKYYDGNVKANGFMPITVAIKEKQEKIAVLKRKFTCDEDAIRSIGLTLKVVDGSERVAITMDMLSDEEREDIEAGLLDFEEVKRAMNNSVIGERISELRFMELTPKKNIAQETAYTPGDMFAAKAKEPEIDLFSDDDDDDL